MSVLRTWGPIAEFFGKSVTTVKRWSRTYPDFPVHKEFGSSRGKVWATRADLVAWAGRHGVAYRGEQSPAH